jgi:hypothetical protein
MPLGSQDLRKEGVRGKPGSFPGEEILATIKLKSAHRNAID